MQPDRTRTPPRQRATLGNVRSRETRRALIHGALRLWSEGEFDEAYEASTAADIARAAGVSKGTFYFHFASKEEVLREVSSATVRALIDRVEEGTQQNIPLRLLSDQVMDLMARRILRAPKAAALRASTLGFAARAGEVTLAGPRLGTAFVTLLRYGKERGELGADIDVEEGAAMLAAVTMEAIIRWGAGDRTEAWLRKTLRDRVDVILRGIGRPGDTA